MIDNYRIRTSDRVPRGTIIMHPDDAAAERSPTKLVAKLAQEKTATVRFPHLASNTRHDDEVAAARIRRQVQEELERRARGIPHDEVPG